MPKTEKFVKFLLVILAIFGAKLGRCQQIVAGGQDYEVADIDCAIVQGGKLELLTAKLRKPEGFRGMPIFADDRGSSASTIDHVNNLLLSTLDPKNKNPLPNTIDSNPCQIFPDPNDPTGRVYNMRITDFSHCGVLKRNGFVHVRVWFPQLPGVVMLSDQEVIIMCKPPSPTVTQSKAAGFAGSIPSGARVSGVVEETPGRLEYEVALFRETNPNSINGGRSVPNSINGNTFITGQDSHELPVDQAVPIGTKLQLRARINPDSSWQHAKLMEVSVSPDPKNPNADGAVALIRDGCRNPELISIIPKQPYRYKDRTNEVVLDFEAFLLSNMGEKNTLWLHTQIKACMEPMDCAPVRDFFKSLSESQSIPSTLTHEDFCMDVYQPSGYGKRRRRRDISPPIEMSANANLSSFEFSSPLSKHWTTFENVEGILSIDKKEKEQVPISAEERLKKSPQSPYEHFALPRNKIKQSQSPSNVQKDSASASASKDKSTNFDENIGFSVIMPAEYYRSSQVLSQTYECRAWATATLFALLIAFITGAFSCVLSYKIRKNSSKADKSSKDLYSFNQPKIVPVRSTNHDPTGYCNEMLDNHHHHPISHQKQKYVRECPMYRP